MRGQTIEQASREIGRSNYPQLQKEFETLKIKFERLNGERGDDKRSQAAVRRIDLQVLGTVEMKSGQVSAAPTQADFNALQSDVATIFKALQRISNVLGNK